MRFAFVLIALLSCPFVSAETTKWTGVDAKGGNVAVPAVDRPSLLAFVRADQDQSAQVLEQIKSSAIGQTQVIILVSGEKAAEQVKVMAVAGKYDWPIVSDPDFKSSGQFNVHVWPTTIIVSPKGEIVAHLAGLSDAFENNLKDYIELAAGQIDQATLDKRLSGEKLVIEAAPQMAGSYLAVAKKLIDGGDLDQAKSQLEAGLKLQPSDIALKLTMARLLVMQKQFKESLDLLDTLPAGAASPGQLAVLRGSALIGLEKWDDAKAPLEQTLGVNPDPAEAHYLLGLISQHNNDASKAAEEFRKAYESVKHPSH
jgi:tetratricopeptide (TPR) repeat protein